MTADRPQRQAVEETDSFISRWSRRKLGGEQALDTRPENAVPQTPAVRIDPRTGKPVDELTDEDMPPLESLGPESDFSVFWSPKVSEGLRRVALRKLFHAPQYNKICLCAEYAEDYTSFTPLGDVVPHDLKRALAREAEALARAAADGPSGTTVESPEAADASGANDAPQAQAADEVTETASAPSETGQGDRSTF